MNLFILLPLPLLAHLFPQDSPIIHLDQSTFSHHSIATPLQQSNWFILFYVTWCPYCKKTIPLWDQLSRHYEGRLDIKIAAVDWYIYGLFYTQRQQL